jgi:hypothetical protein
MMKDDLIYLACTRSLGREYADYLAEQFDWQIGDVARNVSFMEYRKYFYLPQYQQLSK